MIKQISIDYLKNAFNIFDDVKRDMVNNGIGQWDDIYPDFKIIENDIINKQAYGYFDNEQLVGYIVSNENFDEDYSAVTWKFTDNQPLIVHRLAVKSTFQGKGVAKKLIQLKAKKDGCLTIRLDAFSSNPKATGFYKGLGYHLAGKVDFRKGMFYCFEKRINLSNG